MVRRHRCQILSAAAFALLALAAVAHAQPSRVDCKDSETGSECHARLKCRAGEDLTTCQRRLLRCSEDESLSECKQRARGRSGGTDRSRSRSDSDGYYGPPTRDRERDRARESRGRSGGRSASRGGRRGGGGRAGGGGGGGGSFEANKTFGIGLELGEPSGLTGKVFVSDNAALDFGVGYIYRHYYYGDGLHLYGDVLFHPVSLASAEPFELPLYIGFGFRFWDFDYCYERVCTYGGSAVGLRVPIGLSFDFNNVPIEIFMQLVPVVDFLYGDYYDRYRDRAHAGIDGSVGFRFYFR